MSLEPDTPAPRVRAWPLASVPPGAGERQL